MEKSIELSMSEQEFKEPINQNLNQEQISKHKKTDKKSKVSAFNREEIILAYRPPVNSLSELVFLNNIEELSNQLATGEYDCNERDNEGATCSWTPLYWAIKLGRTEIVKLLLQNGANINLVINDSEECCGTVLDLATIRGDELMESILREFAEKEDVNLGQAFKAIRTKLRGKAPSFNFRSYTKKKDAA